MFSVNTSLKRLASVCGTLLGGWIYGRYGGRVLFVGVGVICCCWAGIVFLVFLLFSKNKKQETLYKKI